MTRVRTAGVALAVGAAAFVGGIVVSGSIAQGDATPTPTATAAAGTVPSTPAPGDTAAHDAVRSGDLVAEGGTIVLGGTTPRLLEDAGHTSVGITSVRVEDCEIAVRLASAAHDRVFSAVAEEGGTLTTSGVQAGARGGKGKVRVYLFRDGKTVCADDASLRGGSIALQVLSVDRG